MSVEIVKKANIPMRRGAPGRHFETFETWFNHVFSLNKDEVLKITLDKNSDDFPSMTGVRYAIKRWNRDHPNKKIDRVWRDTHTKNPVIYLFPEKKEKAKDGKT
jgi:hypothetical protein